MLQINSKFVPSAAPTKKSSHYDYSNRLQPCRIPTRFLTSLTGGKSTKFATKPTKSPQANIISFNKLKRTVGFFIIAYMVYTWFYRWRYIQCLCLGLVLSFTVFIGLTVCLSVMYFVYDFIINNNNKKTITSLKVSGMATITSQRLFQLRRVGRVKGNGVYIGLASGHTSIIVLPNWSDTVAPLDGRDPS